MNKKKDLIRDWYDQFDAPITDIDCGVMCAPHNPSGKPFCCDICHAVPAAYLTEWDYLQEQTDLWRLYRGDECAQNPMNLDDLLAFTPEHMLLIACKGPEYCQRSYRSFSCRQFPFFPYVTKEMQFIGLAYEWNFEETCWVISNLGQITSAYQQSFTAFYDMLFTRWEHDLDSYAGYAEEMRAHFTSQQRSIPLLHRDGGFCLIDPVSEHIKAIPEEQLPRFGPYALNHEI